MSLPNSSEGYEPCHTRPKWASFSPANVAVVLGNITAPWER
jgi:hypothetical protein